MSLVFSIEPLKDLWPEWLILAHLHWEETEMHAAGEPCNPQYGRYAAYAEIGWYLEFTARHEGELVGHCGMYLTPSMHSQVLEGTEDTLFIRKEHRRGRNALNFGKYIEAEMIKRGATKITMTAVPGSAAEAVLKYMGFHVYAHVMTKTLL